MPRRGTLARGAAAIALTALLAVSSAHAAAGDTDSSFGVDGRVTVNFTPSPFGGYADYAFAVAVQPDRKTIVGGSTLAPHATGFDNDFALVRLLPNGSLDPSFGGGEGRVTADAGAAGGQGQIEDIVLQPDGKVVAVGYSGFLTSSGILSPGVVVARYTGTGDLDPSFGTGGFATLVLSRPVYAYGVTLQPDGKIVVTGSSFLARYLPDGTPDPTFGANGLVLDIGFTGYDVALQMDGRIVVGGGDVGAFVAARFTASGTLDVGFGDLGVARLVSGMGYYSLEGRAMALQADGSVLVAGRITEACCSGGSFGVARWTVDGDLDSTFGHAGVATIGFDGYAYFGDSATSVVVQPDGMIVLGGWSMQLSPGPLTEFALARLDVDGRLDPQFGVGGRVLTPFFTSPGFPNLANSEIMDLALAADGAILAAGFTFTSAGSDDFGVARYRGDNLDGIAPVITAPDGIAVPATSADGATVDYSVSAVDDVDGPVSVACSPPSGSTFPVGKTAVECTSTDAAENTATASFEIHVKGAVEQVEDMLVFVQTSVPRVLGSSLLDKLVAVRELLSAGEVEDACDVLHGFVNQVQAQKGKRLASDQADALIADARRIRAVLDC